MNNDFQEEGKRNKHLVLLLYKPKSLLVQYIRLSFVYLRLLYLTQNLLLKHLL